MVRHEFGQWADDSGEVSGDLVNVAQTILARQGDAFGQNEEEAGDPAPFALADWRSCG